MVNETKKRTTVYLKTSFLSLLKARDINLSELLNDVVYKALLKEDTPDGLARQIYLLEKEIENNTVILACLKDELKRLNEGKEQKEREEEEKSKKIERLIKEGKIYIKSIENNTISPQGWRNLSNFLGFTTVGEAKLFIKENLERILERAINEAEE